MNSLNLKPKHILPAALLLASQAVFAQWPNMQTDTLTSDNIPDQTVFRSLDIDDHSTLHLAWQRSAGTGRVGYMKKSCSGTWTTPVFVNDTAFAAGEAFLGVNRLNGQPYIAYMQYTTVGSEVIVARDSSGTWVRTQLTSTATDEYSPSVAIDGNGYAHAAWIGFDQNNDYKIFYSTNMSGLWATQMLSGSNLGSFGSGAAPFIAVGNAGKAYIAYRGGDYGSYRVHIVNNDQPGGSNWNYQVNTTPNLEDFMGAIAVKNNTLYLLTAGNDGWGFPMVPHYREYDLTNLSWSTPQQVSSSVYGEISPLFIDSQGYAHTMINEVSGNFITGDIYYASNSTGSWTTVAISAQQNTFRGSVVINSYGNKFGTAYHEHNYDMNSHDLVFWSSGSCEVVTGIETGSVTDISIYPNPAAGDFFVAAGESAIKEITVIDMLGRSVLALDEQDTQSAAISTAGIGKGIYFVKVATADARVHIRKLVIE